MNTAEGSTRLLRQHGPNGTKNFRIIAKVLKLTTGILCLCVLSIHLPVSREETQLNRQRFKVWSSCHYGNSSIIPSSVSVQFLRPNNIVLYLQCPRVSTAFLHECIDFKTLRWMTCKDTKTERWREAGQSVSISDCQAALISCKQWKSPYWPLTAQQGICISNQMWKQSGHI